MRHVLLSAVLATVPAALSAQGRVWIVDAANGAGAHFTDLPPAEAAAMPGDVLVVRAGRYSPLATSKGIAVLGVTGQTVIWVPTLPWAALTVDALPAGQTFAARGLTIDGPYGGQVVLRGCAGLVHLQEIDSALSYDFSAVQVAVANCRHVTLIGCGRGRFPGPLWVNATTSELSIVDCVLVGPWAIADQNYRLRMASPGLQAVAGSRVRVTSTSLRGGDGVIAWLYAIVLPSAPGVLMQASEVVVTRASNVNPYLVEAGQGADPTRPISGISGTGSVRLDPNISVVPYAAAPPIGAGIVATVAPTAGLSATGGRLGGQATIELRSQPSDPFLIAAGLPAAPLSTSLGTLLLDPANIIFIAFGVQGASRVTTLGLGLPNNAVLAGVGLGLQAASGLGWELTNSAVLVLQ